MQRHDMQGFSMIEVLVSLFIISISLLGAAGIQVRAMQLGQGSQLRTQAILLTDDLAERMEANKTASINTTTTTLYNVAESSSAPTTAPATDCSTATCTATEMAAYDLNLWQKQVQNTLPQSTWSVNRTGLGNPATYQITVKWVDTRGDNTANSATASGVVFSYVSTRTLFQ